MSSDIDWYQHYVQKLPSLSFTKEQRGTFYSQEQVLLDKILDEKPNRVIEVGCGLARNSLVLASRGLEVTCFDRDQRFLDLAQQNAMKMGTSVTTIQGDFFQLSDFVNTQHYDIAFHSGVLEHFEDSEIVIILKEQLKVASKVIFSVPIRSEFNTQYFQDNVFRRLLTQDAWLQILAPFEILETKTFRARHDDVMVVIR